MGVSMWTSNVKDELCAGVGRRVRGLVAPTMAPNLTLEQLASRDCGSVSESKSKNLIVFLK